MSEGGGLSHDTGDTAAQSRRRKRREEPAVDQYEDQKRRARDPDVEVRKALAADPFAKPEILYFLAEDESPDVRRAVAQNESTPRQADLILTQDSEMTIRGDLAVKIARLTPDLPEDRRTTLYKLTVRALETLAEDQMVRVREILADALKDMARAPPNVILTLARDRELTVASPVLEFSPVLSDSDLLSIIRSGPIQGAMNAIAKRREVTESVSDAIARVGDEAAVASLLSNGTAQIREDTLDFIIDQAPDRVSWHEPLAMRPRLSPRAVQRIASFVAMNLLDRMQKRLDLDDETLVAVADLVERRLAEDTKKKLADPTWAEADDVDDQIDRLHKIGGLTAKALEKALAEGEKRFVVKALAKLSGVAVTTIQRIVSNRSGKGVVALTWKSGLKPHFAAQLQSQLIGLGPKESIRVEPDRWPMTNEAMQWQLDFHDDSGSGLD